MKHFLNKKHITILEQHPHSPYQICLFPKLKYVLKGKQFESIGAENLKNGRCVNAANRKCSSLCL